MKRDVLKSSLGDTYFYDFSGVTEGTVRMKPRAIKMAGDSSPGGNGGVEESARIFASQFGSISQGFSPPAPTTLGMWVRIQ